MFRSMKKGFGFAVGVCLGTATVKVASERYLKWLVNNDRYMDGLKERNPKSWEEMQKYK